MPPKMTGGEKDLKNNQKKRNEPLNTTGATEHSARQMLGKTANSAIT